jgi:hypothetical protein
MNSISFQFETEYGLYSDAIVLADGVSLSDSEIETIKQQRLNNWISIITAPSVEDTN